MSNRKNHRRQDKFTGRTQKRRIHLPSLPPETDRRPPKRDARMMLVDGIIVHITPKKSTGTTIRLEF